MGITFGEMNHEAIGPISFAAGDQGLLRVGFCSLIQLKEESGLDDPAPSLTGIEVIGSLLAEMNEYLFGIRKDFSVSIDWESIPRFQREVLEITAEIAYGELKTYGEIANLLGKPGAARAVGHALGSNPMPIVIPCHRVTGSDRKLHGYLGGLEKKAFLLNLEGHQVYDDHMVID